MKIKSFFLTAGKLLVCSLVFIVGAVVGGMVVTVFGLQSPPMPEGVDSDLAFVILMLETPLLVLALILIGRGLGGGLLPRAITLSIFTWVVYTLNTAIESLAFTSMSIEGAIFTTISFLPSSIFCGMAVAFFFPPADKYVDYKVLVKDYFGSRPKGAWIWRLTLAGVIFVPVYLLFGSLVAPLTSRYFQESTFGLQLPNQEEILLVLLIRSGLFLLACLPVIILWSNSRRSLFLDLGFALFVLVGLLYMLGAHYLPLEVRIPHTLEILADSFVHAGLLVVLLAKRKTQTLQVSEANTLQRLSSI
jgi:hypothetical protein